MNKKFFTDTIYQMAVGSQRDELRQELTSLLLKDARFTDSEGAWLRGKEVAVWIDPRAQRGSLTFSVLITVQPLHAPKSDLEGVPLTLIRKGRVTLLRPPSLKLNRRGQVMFQNLPLGMYGLIVQKHKSPPLPLPARYYEEPYRQAVNFDTEPALFEEYTVGDFICTVEAAREPQSVDILLSFETNQPIASNALLRFSLVTEETEEVTWVGFALLQPGSRAGYWTATVRMEEDLRFPGPVRLQEPELVNPAELSVKDLDALRWSLNAAEDRSVLETWLREQLAAVGAPFVELLQQLGL